MISLLPTFRETMVLPWSADDIHARLAASTSNKPFLQPDEHELLFTGWVMPRRMRISLRVRRGNYYLPLVIGQLEETSTGCILLLRYTLFPVTRLLLQLWTVLLVLGALMVSYQYSNLLFLPGGGMLIGIIYFITWSNFRLQLNMTHEAILRVVS
ncbi:MAG TPA: hypothetical protein PKI78_11750 [Anaerolineales bacterium]|nr:hypothetical protein [Anaerolineales bacterium]